MIKKIIEDIATIPKDTIKQVLDLLDKDLSITVTNPMYGGIKFADEVEFMFTETVSKKEIV